ncbi:MAG: hypothetical protein J6R59_09785 [Paludibacteraceae bacterium]|nr:hypothetical protein [Paludibacteraceae bacterium]
MSDNIRVIADKQDIVDIADAVRSKINSVAKMTLGEIANNIRNINTGSGVNLDAEVTTQENVISSQDTLIASIASALEGKAAGGSGGVEVPLVTVTYTSTDVNVKMKYFTLVDNAIQEVTIDSIIAGDSGTIQVAKYTSVYIESLNAGTGMFDEYFPSLRNVFIENRGNLYVRPGDEGYGYTHPITSDTYIIIKL